MENKAYRFINSLIFLLIILLSFLIPLVFSGLMTNYFDIPKLVLLVVLTLILYGLWILSFVFGGKIVLSKTPLNIPLLFLLIVVIISTIFGTSKNSSIYGILPEVHGSAVSWITYILLYFVTVSNLESVKKIKTLLYTLYLSAGLLSLITIVSFFGLYLPFDIAKTVNFSPTGSTFSVLSFLLLLLPLTLFLSVNKNVHLPQVIAVFISLLFSLAILLTGSTVIYLIFLAIYLLCFFVNLSKPNLPYLLVPILFSLGVFILTILQFPGNKIYEIRKTFPQEVQLPFNISWKIAATTLRDSPLIGTGPATFLYNFTSYKPVEFNNLSFWNFVFGTAYNEFLQFLGTLGFLGFLSIFVLCIVLFIYSYKYLFLRRLDSSSDETHILLPALACSVLVSIILLCVHSSTLTFIFVMFLIISSFFILQKHIRENFIEFSNGPKINLNKVKIDLISLGMFALYFIIAVFLAGRIYKAVKADYYHRLALIQTEKDGAKTYEYLQKAEVLNPAIDLYRVNMAQTNFALANALVSQKGPTKDNPERLLSDDDKQTVQTLLTQAINEGRASVALSPRSSRNWQVLALIYKNISGVAKNSLAFALDAYGRAIQLDPLNPRLRVDVGLIYQSSQNYELAVRFFTDAVNLKPDYVNGYYNLAVAYKSKGELENAKKIAEYTVNLLKNEMKKEESLPEELRAVKMKDYNTLTDLLNEINKKIESDLAGKEDKKEESSSDKPILPSVNIPSLENPPKVNTPPEVEKNPSLNLP